MTLFQVKNKSPEVINHQPVHQRPMYNDEQPSFTGGGFAFFLV